VGDLGFRHSCKIVLSNSSFTTTLSHKQDDCHIFLTGKERRKIYSAIGHSNSSRETYTSFIAKKLRTIAAEPEPEQEPQRDVAPGLASTRSYPDVQHITIFLYDTN
jgi:hypothetical protein